MKYVIIELDSGQGLIREIPIIFGADLVHHDVSEAVIRGLMLADESIIKARPVSAGFISSTLIHPGCGGQGESLKLQSRGKVDDDLIKLHDYTHGLI